MLQTPPTPPIARRELAEAAREALDDTHAREASARRRRALKRAVSWLAVALGLGGVAAALTVEAFASARRPVAATGAGVALVGVVALALPRLKKRWLLIRRAGLVEHVYDDEAS